MCVLFCPRPSQKTKRLGLFLFKGSQISITCFGLRPDHMVSDLQLIKKNYITWAQLPYSLLSWQLSLSLTKFNLSSTKLEKVLKLPPLRGLFFSLPLLHWSLSSLVLRPLPAELINSSLVSSSQMTGLAECWPSTMQSNGGRPAATGHLIGRRRLDWEHLLSVSLHTNTSHWNQK